MAFKRISNPIPVLQPRVLIEIDNLMIQDEYKKKGIGKLLLQKIEDWAKEIKVTDIELHVW
jgi:GNAT superfamily N-acetyltransferase